MNVNLAMTSEQPPTTPLRLAQPNASFQPPLDSERLFAALESGNFETVFQTISRDRLVTIGPDRFTPLHYASQHGRPKVAKYLVGEYNYSPDLRSKSGLTPLHLAAKYGHLNVVQVLAEGSSTSTGSETASDKECCSLKDEYGRTPLYYAAENGHLDVVRYLISEKQCDPSSKTTKFLEIGKFMCAKGNTPLHAASREGHLHVVQYLINDGKCDPLVEDEIGLTPLHDAAENGQLEVVRYLIDEQQADPSHGGKNQYTPLHLASGNGHIEVVKFLTEEKQCNPLCKNGVGNTPLHHAALGGHLDILKYFITEKKCDPIAKGRWERTPLHDASQKGHFDMVKYLINEQQTDPSCLDGNGITPLHLASLNGHIAIVKFLTDEKMCDPKCRDKAQNMPLHLAAAAGSLDIVKFFVSEKHCDPRCRGQQGRTALHHASQEGHLDVVKFLISEQHVDPSCSDKIAITPLHLACLNAKTSVVRFLSEQTRCDLKCRDKKRNTPLHLAAIAGNLDIVKYLISEKDCDPFNRGDFGLTLLHLACMNGCLDLVKHLINECQTNPSCKDEDGDTPLHLASQSGHIAIVRYLTEEEQCDPKCKSANGNTPLNVAALAGQLEVLKFFITEKQCDPMCRGWKGRTPLHDACQNGHLDIVKYLTDEKHVDPSCRDEDQNITPLHIAASNGSISVVKHLITTKQCNIAPTTKLGKTPLDLAQEQLQIDTVLYLISKGAPVPHDLKSVPCDVITFMVGRIPLLQLAAGSVPPVSPRVNIYAVGNSGAGKSTLVKALQDEVSYYMGQIFSVKVTPKTAGIIPKEFTSSMFGQVTLYDLAGHEEYHAGHEMVFESTSQPVVLMAVDLRKSTDEMKREITYWHALIANAISAAGCRADIIIVGSHPDALTKQALDSKTVFLSEIVELPSPFQALKLFGPAILDCRKSSSPGMLNLRQLLEQRCKSMRLQIEFDYNVACRLMSFITRRISKVRAYTFDELYSQVYKSGMSEVQPLKHPLILYQACESLNASGHLMFLKYEERPEESWIIFNKEDVLAKVHGFMKFLETRNEMGIVTLSQLEAALRQLEKQFHPDMAIRYMLKMALCSEVDPEALKLVAGSTSFPEEERYFFFPTLVSDERPTSIWMPGRDCYCCAWVLKCTETFHFFTPRFLQLLLTSLACRFAMILQPDSQRQSPTAGCRLWKNGIHWLDADGIEAIVKVTEQNSRVTVVMNCRQRMETKCLKLRSSVIQQIRSIRAKICPEISPKEYLLHPHCLQKYPIPVVAELPMNEVARSIVSKKEFLAIDNRDLEHVEGYPFIELSKLLHFEPYQSSGVELLQTLFDPSCESETVSQESIEILSTVHVLQVQWKTLANILLENPEMVTTKIEAENYRMEADKCQKVLSSWMQSTKRTYADLRRSLNCYSIFAGENPLVSRLN